MNAQLQQHVSQTHMYDGAVKIQCVSISMDKYEIVYRFQSGTLLSPWFELHVKVDSVYVLSRDEYNLHTIERYNAQYQRYLFKNTDSTRSPLAFYIYDVQT